MANDQALTLETRTALRLSVQQLRFVKLLEYNAPELEEAVDRELEENPALDIVARQDEKEDSHAGFRSFSVTRHEEDHHFDFSPADSEESLSEVLIRQLSEKNISEEVKTVARYIIGNLDSNGYLRRGLEGIVNDMAFNAGIEVNIKDAREALDVVQSLEPYGVGASDLQECLILQLRKMPESEQRDDALRIVETQFEALSMKHTHRIISKLKISSERVANALSLIRSLNPKPGASFGNSEDKFNVIVPDVAVNLEDDDISIFLPNNIPELVIDRSFSEAVAELEEQGKKRKKKGSEFVISRYNDARDFIRILHQRQETLMAVATAIVKIQREYFLTQDLYKLKPMMIKDIAALTGLDFSVISRATNNKFISTPWGVFPMRFFFSDSIGEESEGEGSDVLTNRKMEAEIADIVDKEDKKHPLSDEKIRLEMEKRGYDVSRRTVAKYRDRKKIPVARLRKEM